MLTDVRLLKGRFGVGEAYFRVRKYPPDRPRVNVAIVDLPENADYEKYQEATARNAGLFWKWFTDIEVARDWLKSMQRGGNESARDSNRDEKNK